MTRSPVSAERLAAAARAQTQLPDGRVTDVRPAWEDRRPDLWGVTVEGGDGRSNAFFRISGDRVAVPAGPDQAARELSELRPLDGRPWGGGLIYVVIAVGGATPGFPDTWSTEETPLPHGGMRVTVTMPEAQVAYAAAGGVGPTPSASSDRGGVTPPPIMATATLDITADYSLQWRYQLGDGEIDGPAGSPAETPPALSDDQLVAALDGARRRARAPRAMPGREPRAFAGHPDVVVVDLWALGPVYVQIGEAATAFARLTSLNVDWSASPSTLVPLLSAADALPPGILPEDLLSTAQVAGGELTASVPAPLAVWAAGGAKQLSPRVQGVRTAYEMSQAGRLRLKLDDSLEWALEVADGGAWRPANGDRP
jgi:hypothetical protein